MSIQDQITADQSAVVAAQAALDAANVQLAADQQKLTDAQPHLSVIGEIESFGSMIIDGQAKQAFDELIAKARALF